MHLPLANACPDCPSKRTRVLTDLVGGRSPCTFRCLPVAARQPLPPRWFGAYGIALVRRGLVVRQRIDPDGSATAVDAIGPGCALPLSDGADSTGAGYAASDVLLCLCPRRPLRAAVDAGGPTASQLLSLYTQTLDRLERIAQARSRPSALARVAALLTALADTLSPPRRLPCIPAALQQRDLAALLAMRHESVCRAIQDLAREGLVRRDHEGLHLRDRERLEAV